MLPFLKNKKDAGIASNVVVKTREPDKTEENQDVKDPADDIHGCMKHFLSCIERKDAQGMAEALHDAHEIMHGRMKPDEESEEPHSYEASKEE